MEVALMWERNQKLWPPEKMSRKPQQIEQKPCIGEVSLFQYRFEFWMHMSEEILIRFGSFTNVEEKIEISS